LTGQPAAHELTIGLTPNLTADKTAVNLAVNAQVVGPNGSTLAHLSLAKSRDGTRRPIWEPWERNFRPGKVFNNRI
jgi:hypothetical protein